MAAYDQYLSGSLFDYEVDDEQVQKYTKNLEQIIK